MKNTIKLLEELRDIVKVDERNIAYVFNSLQRIITEAKGSLQQSHKSAEDWLKKHNYVDSGIEWNPLTSTNEGMRVSISSVLDQFISSQQSNEWVKVEDRLPEIGKVIIAFSNNIVFPAAYENNGFWWDTEEQYTKYIEERGPITRWRELPQPPK